MTEPFSITTLREEARILQVAVDASMEEIKEAYERRRRESQWPQNIDFVWNQMKRRKKCAECRRFGNSLYMKLIPPYNSEIFFCGDECLNVYKLRLLKSSSIQEIKNQLQQKRINRVEDFGDNLIEIQALFPWNCQCDHPWTYEHHINNCLATNEQIEDFKNQFLNIIAKVSNQNVLPVNPQSPNSTPTNPISNHAPFNPNHSHSSPNYSSNSVSSTSNSSDSVKNYESNYSSDSYPTSSNKYHSSSDFPSKKQKNNPLTSEEKPVNNNLSSSSTNLPNPKGQKTTLISSDSSLESSRKENNEPPFSSSEKNFLWEKKQQIIQENEKQLNQFPNLSLDEFTNWKEEIIQSQSLESIITCQKNLLEKLAQQKALLKPKDNIIETSKQTSKGFIPWLVAGVILAGGAILLAFYFKPKKINK